MSVAEIPTGEDAAEGRPSLAPRGSWMERMLAAIGISADARVPSASLSCFHFARRTNELVGHRGLRRYRPPPHCRTPSRNACCC